MLRKLIVLIIITIISVHYCNAQFEYVYGSKALDKPAEIINNTFQQGSINHDVWIQTLRQAENKIMEDNDYEKVTGSLARLYTIYYHLNNHDGKNRCIQKLNYLDEQTNNMSYLQAQILICNDLAYHNKFKEAIAKLKEAEKYLISKNNDAALALLYCEFGDIYAMMFNKVLRMRYMLMAVDIVEKMMMPDLSIVGEVYIRMAITYYSDGDYEKAKGYIEGAFCIINHDINSDKKSLAYVIEGDIFRSEGKNQKAVELYQNSIDIFPKWGNYEILAMAYNGIGISYQTLRYDSLALSYMQKALSIRINEGNRQKICESYITLANYYKNINNEDSLFKYYTDGFKIAYELRNNKLINKTAIGLSNYYSRLKDYTKAYKYLRTANHLYSDSAAISQDKGVMKEEMEYIYADERRQAKIKNQIAEDTIKNGKRLIIVMIVGIIIVVILLIIIALLLYKSKRKNKQLSFQRDKLEQRSIQLLRQQEEISQKNQILSTTTEMLEERNKELHKLSVVASVTDNAIFISDTEGNVTWFNQSFARITGLSYCDIGSHPALLAASMPDETRVVYDKVKRTKISEIYTMQIKHMPNLSLWVQTTVTPVLDENQNIKMLISVCTDISELKLANEKIDAQNKEINDSITYARRIQDAIQPMKLFTDEVLGEHFIINLPKNIVSGDFHWVGYKNGLSVFTVADCTGHGVPGAFISALGQVMLNNVLCHTQNVSSSNILSELRRNIILQLHQRDKADALSDGIDASMFVYDRKNCILDYSGAYSNAFLLRFGTPDSATLKVIAESGSKITYSDDKSAYLISLKHDNMPVGANRRDNNPFKSIKIHVNHGDIAYATTDGYPDQFGGSMGKRLRINTFEKNILKFCHLPLEEQSKKMLEVYQNWKGNYEQTDDVHVMGVIL